MQKKQLKDYLKSRKERLKNQGLCQDCGQRPPRRLNTLCIGCLISRRNSAKRRYHAKKHGVKQENPS